MSNPRSIRLNVGHPGTYTALMDTASDPRFLASAMLAGTTPRAYMSYLQRLRNPESLRSELKSITVENALDRAYSAMDPEFETALLSRASNLQIANHWMEAMRDPTYFQSAIAVVNAPAQWLRLDANGQTTQPSMNWFDRRTYRGWARLMTSSTDAKTEPAYSSPQVRPLLFSTPPQRY